MLYFADDTRGVLLGRSRAHRNGFSVRGGDAVQFIDDMQHIVAASFFAVGHDVDARSVLVFDRLKSGLVQQSCKLGLPQFLLETVKRKPKAVEQRSTVLLVDVARLWIAAYDGRQDF